MKIYHYTSIETLALILKNKTIRFSRLDRVDDPDEYSFESDGVTPAHYCFVSCWTKNRKENLPQWYIYGNSTHGVRIELDSDMFEVHDNKFCPSFFDEQFVQDKHLMILPILKEGLLRNIEYVDEIKSVNTEIFQKFEDKNAISFKEVGIYKCKDWSFQNECRFIFFSFPILPSGKINIDYLFQNNISPSVTYLDIPIKEECLMNIKILLGPKVTEAEQIIVKSLMERFLRRNDCEKSYYTDKL